MKSRLAMLSASVAAGIVLAALSLFVRSDEYRNAAEWDPSVPDHATVYEKLSQWGWPLAFVRDSPVGGNRWELGSGDDLLPVAMVFDFMFFAGLAFGAIQLVSALSRRGVSSRAAGSVETELVQVGGMDGTDEESGVSEPGVEEPEIGGDAVKSDRYGIFKVIATCTSCGNPVVVNGPLAGPACPSCRKELEIPPDVWESIIGDFINNYHTTEPGSGDEGTLMSGGLTIKYSTIRLPPPDPACPACEENWDLPSVENGANRKMVCGKCGRETDTYPAPSWLREVVPQAKQVFFAERESEQSENAIDTATKPVALSCPQCGGGLLITAESERTVPCKYCNVDVYLPDGVWLKLHPAKKAKFWMVRFDG